MRTRSLPLSALLTVALATMFSLVAAGCGDSAPPPKAAKPTSQLVFDLAAPSVVAILNDDRADREREIKEFEKSMGDESHAPKKVIDVSLRKDPTPHGTGFMIEGGLIATAAHVVLRPDRLKITTRSGQTVDADLDYIDEVRDVALLRPKQPLKDVPVLPFGTVDPVVGQSVWSLGHTGHGFWALSWGMSEGIASGIVEMFGEKLLLFDAAVYPGFSGGPVVTMEADGKPHVVGVNHAILFTGGSSFPIGPISSAASLVELRATAAHSPAAIEAKLVEYAKKQHDRQYADVFITDKVSVVRDPHDNQVASFMGNAKQIEIDDGRARIPALAMIFNLPKGKSTDVTFEISDPNNAAVASETAPVRVAEHQRVSFVSTSLRFRAKTGGKYSIAAKLGDKELGRSFVTLTSDEEDDELADDHDADSADDNGDPDVDIVVAAGGRPEPLAMIGIQSAWLEKSYPRRVAYSWFARGTRGWSGTFVSVSAFVLDENNHIVGRSDGCLTAEMRPEHTWACMGSGGLHPPPLPRKEGPYDIVFAINDRPVAWWPMEAMIRQEHAPGSDVERWSKELRRHVTKRRTKIHNEPLPPPPPKPPEEPKTTPPKPGQPAPPPKPR